MMKKSIFTAVLLFIQAVVFVFTISGCSFAETLLSGAVSGAGLAQYTFYNASSYEVTFYDDTGCRHLSVGEIYNAQFGKTVSSRNLSYMPADLVMVIQSGKNFTFENRGGTQ